MSYIECETIGFFPLKSPLRRREATENVDQRARELQTLRACCVDTRCRPIVRRQRVLAKQKQQLHCSLFLSDSQLIEFGVNDFKDYSNTAAKSSCYNKSYLVISLTDTFMSTSPCPPANTTLLLYKHNSLCH